MGKCVRIICIELYSHVFPFRPDTDGQPNPMDITTTGYGSSKIATAASNRCRITAEGLLGVEDFSQRPRKALALQWVSLLLCQLFCQSGWENLHIELVIPTWRIGSSSSAYSIHSWLVIPTSCKPVLSPSRWIYCYRQHRVVNVVLRPSTGSPSFLGLVAFLTACQWHQHQWEPSLEAHRIGPLFRCWDTCYSAWTW